MDNVKRLIKIIISIIIAIITMRIAIQFFISVNPIFYLFFVLALFLNRDKIKGYIEGKLDNRVNKTLKNNDYESVIVEEDVQEEEKVENQDNNTNGNEEEPIGSLEFNTENLNNSAIEDNNEQENTKDIPLPEGAREISYEEVMKIIEEENQRACLAIEGNSSYEEKDPSSSTIDDDLNKDLPTSENDVQPETEPKNSQVIVGENDNDKPNKNITNHHTKIPLVTITNTYFLPMPYKNYLDNGRSSMSNINNTAAAVKGEKILEIFENNKINAVLLNTYIGPRYTRFEFKPDSSINLSRIKNLSENIRMELVSREIYIEAPIPGKTCIGIDIPNVEPKPVRMIHVINKVPSSLRKNKLIFPLGCNIIGEPVFCDLEKSIHLLIGGTTGSGKTMCLHSIIMSFLLRTKPDEVKLVLIDLSKAEFSAYKDIPHLMWPVIEDAEIANVALRKLIVILEERYDLLAKAGVKNIKSYNDLVIEHNSNLKDNKKAMPLLPYIVVIVDQYAELKSFIGSELEMTIQRLTQLSRICGVHIIISTQRPSNDVVTGVIKSCFPSRISFALPAAIDSKTIINQAGAEYLLGEGDMLYHPVGQVSPIRVQGVFVSDREINNVTKFVKSQDTPDYEDSYYELLSKIYGTTVMSGPFSDPDYLDSLYDEVVEFVVAQQKASTSLLQRRFGIGYNRAARLIDTLEDRGIIGPANGAKPREVYRKYK